MGGGGVVSIFGSIFLMCVKLRLLFCFGTIDGKVLCIHKVDLFFDFYRII